MLRTDYENYLLTATAFKDDDGEWVGQTVLRSLEGNPVKLQNAMVFDNQRFHSKEEAEGFALDGAQFFIDTQLKHSGLE